MLAFEFFSKFWEGFFNKKTIKLPSGSYNSVCLVHEPIVIEDLDTLEAFEAFWVVKKPKKNVVVDYPMLNSPDRAVRKWRAINPDFPAYSYRSTIWTVPFLGLETANDEMIQECIIDIYRRTGNIIADAANIKNFVKFNNKAVCIDMDLALRRNSISSDAFFNIVVQDHVFEDFMRREEEKGLLPLTIQTVKTLFFLESCLNADEYEYKNISPWVLQVISDFQARDIPITKLILDILIKLENEEDVLSLKNHLLQTEVLCLLTDQDLNSDCSHHLKNRLEDLSCKLSNKMQIEESFTDFEFRDSDCSSNIAKSPPSITDVTLFKQKSSTNESANNKFSWLF